MRHGPLRGNVIWISPSKNGWSGCCRSCVMQWGSGDSGHAVHNDVWNTLIARKRRWAARQGLDQEAGQGARPLDLVRGAADSLPGGCADLGSPASWEMAPPAPSVWLVQVSGRDHVEISVPLSSGVVAARAAWGHWRIPDGDILLVVSNLPGSRTCLGEQGRGTHDRAAVPWG